MKTLLFFLIIFNVLGALAQKPQTNKELTLSLGESHNLQLRGQDSVWIQDREILKAEGRGSLLTIRGLKEGKTILKVGSALYEVQVLHPMKTHSVTDLKSLMKTIVGLRSQVSDGDLLITGQLYRLQDWIKIAQFSRERSFNYQMRIQMSPELQSEAQIYFRDLFQKAKVPPQTLIFEPSPEVRVNASELSLKKYSRLLSHFGIAVIKDESSLDIAPTVKVQITVAEVKRSVGIQYGLSWKDSFSAQVLPTGKLVRGAVPLNVSALEDSGDLKILASPNLLCRSGKEAEFLAGGEFPIKIMNYKAQDVVWKRYGVLLRVKPKADSGGRISLSIETEVTTLDPATSVDNIPGLLTNRVSSHFDLTGPQTIALSGMIKNDKGTTSSGLPFLSRLPVLGSLFSSKSFSEGQSELVIFVRPTILNENDSGEGSEHLQSSRQSL